MFKMMQSFSLNTFPQPALSITLCGTDEVTATRHLRHWDIAR